MMFAFDMITIGNKLLNARKHLGLTQAEVAELAGISGRTYADIERGTVNMRIETFLRICNALKVSPNEVLTEDDPPLSAHWEELLERLSKCTPKQRETALKLLAVYLQSLE